MKVLRLNLFFSSLFLTVAFLQAQSTELEKRCPKGYFLHTDELCYLKVRKPCPFESQKGSPPSTNMSSSTIQSPLAEKKLDCPEGSIMMKNKCHKIICSLGEYYRGSCLKPVCPQGLVWHHKKCQEPGYLTTFIEIDNDIISEINEKPIGLVKSHVNEIVYHTSTTTTSKPFTNTRLLPLMKTTQQPKYSTIETTTIHDNTDSHYFGICCKVFTPRICKLYGRKWLCFNRRYQRCDSRICSTPIVYLKAPEIKYEPQLLVMPPNQQLDACVTNNCQSDSNAVDCSGCASLRSENCSPYCYRYICPSDICTFIDLNEYCRYYPGENGCLPIDGCLWKWCQI